MHMHIYIYIYMYIYATMRVDQSRYTVLATRLVFPSAHLFLTDRLFRALLMPSFLLILYRDHRPRFSRLCLIAHLQHRPATIPNAKLGAENSKVARSQRFHIVKEINKVVLCPWSPRPLPWGQLRFKRRCPTILRLNQIAFLLTLNPHSITLLIRILTTSPTWRKERATSLSV